MKIKSMIAGLFTRKPKASRMSFAQALRILSKAIPAKAFSVRGEVWYIQQQQMQPEFSVWDDNDHHRGSSLEDAVEACLKAHAEKAVPKREFNPDCPIAMERLLTQ